MQIHITEKMHPKWNSLALEEQIKTITNVQELKNIDLEVFSFPRIPKFNPIEWFSQFFKERNKELHAKKRRLRRTQLDGVKYFLIREKLNVYFICSLFHAKSSYWFIFVGVWDKFLNLVNFKIWTESKENFY